MKAYTIAISLITLFAILFTTLPGSKQASTPTAIPNEVTRHLHNSNKTKSSNSHRDYSNYSCDHLYLYAGKHSSRSKQCAYARTCNQGDGIIAPAAYCNRRFSTRIWNVILTPFLAIVVLVMFRMVASTAEDYFCPTLEMLSVKMGLPTRFAGVTLLALGNGAPDIAATVNAMRNDVKVGYLMSLGELTGAGMFIGSVITGVVVVIADGVPCPAALLRDVIMFLITLVVIYYKFAVVGFIGRDEVVLFFGMYFSYVMIVLASDLYHRNVVLPRSERLKMQKMVDGTEVAVETTVLVKQDPARRSTSMIEHVIEVVSNYDDLDRSNHSGWSEIEVDEHGEEKLIVVHVQHGGVRSISYGRSYSNDYDSVEGEAESIADRDSIKYSNNWHAVREEGTQELTKHITDSWKDIYSNENHLIVKILSTLELPFTILRQLTVPIPCDGYYCRPMVGISTILSVFWLWFYFIIQQDINIFTFSGRLYGTLIFCLPFFIGLMIFRLAPIGNGHMPSWASTPLSIYGFVVAATWIDFISDKLVQVLSFLGIVFHISGPVMGLSVLAVGNSYGDMAANMVVAKKGLANMAVTACFAGPVFNFLIGLGLGFSALLRMTELTEIPVKLTISLHTGFIFSILNCVLVIIFGAFLGKGTLKKEYGYAALTIYTLYAMISLGNF